MPHLCRPQRSPSTNEIGTKYFRPIKIVCFLTAGTASCLALTKIILSQRHGNIVSMSLSSATPKEGG